MGGISSVMTHLVTDTLSLSTCHVIRHTRVSHGSRHVTDRSKHALTRSLDNRVIILERLG